MLLTEMGMSWQSRYSFISIIFPVLYTKGDVEKIEISRRVQALFLLSLSIFRFYFTVIVRSIA